VSEINEPYTNEGFTVATNPFGNCADPTFMGINWAPSLIRSLRRCWQLNLVVQTAYWFISH